VEMGDRRWLSFFKAEGRRLAFVGWELGFSGGAAAVWCVRGRKWGLPWFSLLLQKGGGRWPGAEVGTLGAIFVLPGDLLAKEKAKLWLVSGEGK